MKSNPEIKVEIELTATVTFTEVELRALNGMFGYGADAFLRGFYKECGRCYVSPFEAGVRSLHQGVRSQVSDALAKVDAIRKKLGS